MTLSRLGIEEQPLPYEQYRSEAMNADILLWRPTTVWGRVIAAGTRGPWCHAAATKWARNGVNRLLSLQYREGIGGYAIPTRDEVKRWPGKCDVFRVNLPKEKRLAIADTLMDTLGGTYAWSNIWLIALGYMPLVRWAHNLPISETWVNSRLADSAAMICSNYVDNGFGQHGVDFIRRESGLVTPNDIGRSSVPDYVGTLV